MWSPFYKNYPTNCCISFENLLPHKFSGPSIGWR